MLEFSPVTLRDRDRIYPLVFSDNIRSADFSFVNIFAWGASYRAGYALPEGCPVICTESDGLNYYSFPVGVSSEEQLKRIIELLIAHCREKGETLRLSCIHPSKLPLLENLFPGRFEITPDTDYFDYVYSAERLCTLAGKKLHSKRNFINRFISEHTWQLVPMNEENLSLWADMDGEWISDKEDSAYDTAFEEAMAIRTAMQYFRELELDGAYLYIDGVPRAFTVGERICGDTYIIHYEKADASIDGAYPMINREFVRYITAKYPDIKYINREDDMGLEGLRKAKRSYYPDFMEEKYTAVMLLD